MSNYFHRNLFVVAIIILCLCAASQYFLQGDWRRGTYWFLAALINITVTL